MANKQFENVTKIYKMGQIQNELGLVQPTYLKQEHVLRIKEVMYYGLGR
jgi:hypothetical protein